MSTLQVPPTRAPVSYASESTQAVPLTVAANNHRRTSLLEVQPRRLKRSGLDSTFEIYDEALFPSAQHGSALSTTDAPHDSKTESNTENLTRRSSLLAVAPLRPGLGRMNSNAANITRRRTSAIRDGQQQNPTAGQSALLNSKKEESQRLSRRRTIYVPADDTTILTIHPGARFNRSDVRTGAQRQSDIFLDLATVTEFSLLQEQHGSPSSVPMERPLAATPRRAPLRRVTRQLQAAAFDVDIPGSGDGKENLPPGTLSETKKDKVYAAVQRDSLLVERLPNRSRPIASKQSPSRSFHVSFSHAISTPNRISIAKSPSPLITRQLDGTQAVQAVKISAASQKKAVWQNPGSSPLVSPARFPLRSQRSPSKINVPIFNSRHFLQKSQQYHVLREHIDNANLYEDDWLSHQEDAITGLVNELFQSSDLCSDVSTTSYHPLRTRLLAIYDSEVVASLHDRLQASLRFGALSISNDTLSRVCRIKDDLGESRKFLDLFLKSYALDYLQAAAEVVIGREVWKTPSMYSLPDSREGTRSPRKQSKALEGFLTRCLLRNEDNFKTSNTSSPRSFSVGNEGIGSPAWLWRRTVVRSLLLVLLLDKAAANGTFQACVFQTTSAYKSSAAFLQALTSLLLPSLGNPSRVLNRMSYEVSHVQYPLQEHQYRICNLATDMRDGVLLARLIELLLYPSDSKTDQTTENTVTLVFNVSRSASGALKSSIAQMHSDSWPLSHLLKYPCTSPAQKLHNVQIALDALSAVNGVGPMLQHVTAKDIVDGHREKTVGLLWSLVGRWGLAMLVDFKLLEMEIARLSKIWNRSTAQQRNARECRSNLNEEELEKPAQSTEASDLYHQTALLLRWAQYVTRLHSVHVTNLSTSFADGHAYQAIADEYGQFIPHDLLNTAPLSSSSTAKGDEPVTIQHTLRTFGCSNSFIALFPTSLVSEPQTLAPAIPSKQTTIPLLAFLASRFLPLARPHIATLMLQRWWRNVIRVKAAKKMWGVVSCTTKDTSTCGINWRERSVKARLARECRDVVQMRARIVRAAVTLQRWWRKCSTTRKVHSAWFLVDCERRLELF